MLVVVSCWELEPPQRPLGMATDHIVYDLVATCVVLCEFYPEKRPFLIFQTNQTLLWAV